MWIETIVIASIVGSVLGAGVLLFERRRRKRELQWISQQLTKLMEKEEDWKPSEYTDTLMSKISHQIFRFKTMTERYEETLERDREEIKNLIAQIAHQLRTPLTNMEVYLEFLKESLNEQEQRAYWKAVKQSQEKIYFLTESFIKMSRLQAKVIQIQKEKRDLAVTIKKAVSQVEKRAEEKKIHIQIQGEMPIVVEHDENWLSEAIYNLLDNAVKYSKEGTKVRVSLQKNDMFAKIQVGDEGIGIVPGEEHKVFQRFYRGSNVAGVEGFGLGLFLTREIVLEHNGFVRIKRGKTGTTVEIYLP